MSRIVFLNGHFIESVDAKVSIFDRGFLFGDGIYEVSAVINGKLIDNEAHLLRLDRSLKSIGIKNPYSNPEWTRLQKEVITRNNLNEGGIYLEVTRGEYERDFTCPPDIKPTVLLLPQAKAIVDLPQAKTGIAVITRPDIRWARRDVKSTSLLAQVLGKFAAKEAGVGETWMVEDGLVTEGASSTAFIIKGNELITRPLSQSVLPSITRIAVLELIKQEGLTLVERAFSVVEAQNADEAFIAAASTLVMPVVKIDDILVKDGKPGALSLKLRALYINHALKTGV
jgi:D-alanine transaminase